MSLPKTPKHSPFFCDFHLQKWTLQSEEDRTKVASRTVIPKWDAQTTHGPVKSVDFQAPSDTAGEPCGGG